MRRRSSYDDQNGLANANGAVEVKKQHLSDEIDNICLKIRGIL